MNGSMNTALERKQTYRRILAFMGLTILHAAGVYFGRLENDKFLIIFNGVFLSLCVANLVVGLWALWMLEKIDINNQKIESIKKEVRDG